MASDKCDGCGQCDCSDGARFYPVDQIIGYVATTIGHGVSESVALKKAERKFKVDRKIIRSFWRGV